MDRKSSIDTFIATARGFVGCRWRHRGRSSFGVDCIGLVVLGLRAAGIEMREHFGDPVVELQPGDVVTMRGIGQPEPGHVGVVAEHSGYLTLIHSYNADSNTRVVEHRIDEHWLGRIAEIYRPFP